MPEDVQQRATETSKHHSTESIYCQVISAQFTLWEFVRTDFPLEVVEKRNDAGVSGSIMGLV